MLSVARLDEFAVTPPARPLEYWNELVCGTFTGLVVDAPEPGMFRARLRRASFGEWVLALPSASASVVRHTPEHVRMAVDESFLIHMQIAGYSTNEQRGRLAHLGPGDFTLCTTSAPYTLSLHGQESQHLVLRVPAPLLRARLSHPEDIVSITVSGGGGIGAVAAGCLRSLWHEIDCGGIGRVPDELMNTVLDLLTTALRTHPRIAADHYARRAVRRQQLLDFVRARLRDPHLSVASVAAALGMSVRNVSKLMSDDGQGLASYILQQRLEGCARWLRDPSRRNMRVSDIAYEWGFGDLSHFSRTFRARFGVSPRAFRDSDGEKGAGGKLGSDFP